MDQHQYHGRKTGYGVQLVVVSREARYVFHERSPHHIGSNAEQKGYNMPQAQLVLHPLAPHADGVED